MRSVAPAIDSAVSIDRLNASGWCGDDGRTRDCSAHDGSSHDGPTHDGPARRSPCDAGVTQGCK
ncbi:hypothetical protein, partial [Klebsiella pneumoniae]|uniref:hypothetical protein n=1 Tax=Klebsiella pneumoniae TaxID=573 RepID=UPI003EE04694